MRKRLISFILVLAMLMSAVPAVSAVDTATEAPKFTARSLLLNKSIAINFKVPYADVTGNFTKAVFIKDGVEIQTIDVLPNKDSNGMAVFTFTELSPLDLTKKITARLYDKNGNYTEAKSSVLDYCNTVLNNPDSSDELKTLVVDLLNYGTAFQTYKGITGDLANSGLTDEQKALGTQTEPQLTSCLSKGTELADPAVTWEAASLALEDSVTIYFKIKASSVEGLTLKVTSNDASWTISEFGQPDTDGIYKIYFDKLNPAQMSDQIVAVVCDAAGNAVSNTLTYSIESYAAYQAENATDEELVSLVKAMMRYGNAAATWADNGSSDTITRADMETALAEVAWDHYIKDVWFQYDSVDLNSRDNGFDVPLSRWTSGFTRISNYLNSLEEATAHNNKYGVCSYYPWAVYYETLDYPLFGNSLNSSTLNFWYYAENPQDMCVIRYHNWAEDTFVESHEEGYVTHEKCVSYEEICDFIRNWEENLRPGDIFYVIGGHSALYVGNGMIIECGGGKYNVGLGIDTVEKDGAMIAWTIEDYFFNENSGSTYFLSRLTKEANARLVILRPLDLLTVDDGDGNPDNDVLNEEYELDIGRLKFQFSTDPNNILKTSGYTIQDSAYSRMEYPAMNINRTVNITPYGTAIKGDTITYTVAISNESNNAKYVYYHSVDSDTTYAGQAYEDLSIVETVPANTTLVSAEGAVVDGNTLRWQIDVPVGQTVAVSYTVRVTGEMGDKIVNGGGWVENIPSNTITNLIGGKKLNSEALSGMQEFFTKDVDFWNSNDGYKITASVNAGTRFAERIYNEAVGMDLQLPEVQELMDMLFTQTLIEEDYGMYLRYANSTTSRYMYRLNDTTVDPANQIYRDMVVDGYYGGIWVYTNVYAGEARTDELRTDYLEPGDILVYMNLTDAVSDGAVQNDRTVAGWQVIVYLGNDEFASLKSNGKLQKFTGTDGVITAFCFDAFVLLRPSQVYEDLNTQIGAYSGPAADLTEDDLRKVYKLEYSDVLLNEALSAKLAAMTPDDGWSGVNTAFAGQVYKKLGIEDPEIGFYGNTYATFMKQLFNDVADEEDPVYNTYEHIYYLIEEPTEQQEIMYESLQYWGGVTHADPNPVTSLNDLHPGDVLLLGIRRERVYVCAVYQGNGKFITGTQNLRGGMYYTGVESYWGSLSFASDAEFLAYLSGKVDATISDLTFEGYIVLRPSRVYENINDVERDIAEGTLTDAEKAALAALTIDDWTNGGQPGNLQGAGVWMYRSANISVSAYLDQSVHNTLGKLFSVPVAGGGYVRKNETNNYQTMLVDKSWGGNDFVGENNNVLTTDVLEIGDLFCGRFKVSNGNVYATVLYQGNNKFLAQFNSTAAESFPTSCYSLTLEQLMEYSWDYSYVLRPAQLAETQGEDPGEDPEVPEEPVLRDIATGKLTDAEKAALAALTVADWTAAGTPGNLAGAGVWMYKAVSIDVSAYLDKTIDPTFKAMFGNPNSLGWEYGNGTSNYDKMLLANSWTGSDVAPSNRHDVTTDMLAVGDIFCGLFKDGSNNVYWTALYQGNGNFLVQQNHKTEGASAFGKTLDEIKAVGWKYSYVLRPEQLAAEPEGPAVPEEPVVRDIITGKLTEAEKGALAALTVEDWTNAENPSNLNAAGVWMYSAANIDVSAYLDLTVYATLGQLFNVPVPGQGYVPMGISSKYQTMLVDKSWGGSDFIGANNNTLTTDILVVGDIFCGLFRDSNNKDVFWTALYQGNGNFLVQQHHKVDGASCFTGTLDDIKAKGFKYSYVLRPEQLAENLPAGESLVMKYDDRMSVSDLGQSGAPVIITDSVTSKKVGTNTPDDAVVTYVNGKLIAVGVGTASVIWVNGGNVSRYDITVEPAAISLFMVTGHSLGAGSQGDGAQSIVCEDGQVYSTNEAAYTFKLTNGNTNTLTVEGKDVTGMGLGYGATQPTDLNALTEAGTGVRGIDSALAYRWHQLTGEKVWVLNASKGSTYLQTWKQGGFNYRHAVALFTTAEKILYNEVQAGHYTVNKLGIVNYTTANGDETWAADQYTTDFNSMWNGFRTDMALFDFDGDSQKDTVDCIGLLPLWNPCSIGNWDNLFPEPLAFYAATGDMYYGKLINYSMSAFENNGVIMASVVGRNWTSDAGVAAYFQANPIAGMYGTLQNGTTHTNPTTMQNGVYGDGVHYGQLGYNVQGIETAESMYEYWYDLNGVTSVKLLQANGVNEVPESIEISLGGTYVVVPEVAPSSAKLAYTLTGDAVSYNGCLLTAEKLGTAILTITDLEGNVLKAVAITVSEDSDEEAEVPEIPGEPEEPVIRDITANKLTDREKAAMAALTVEDWTYGGSLVNLNGAGVWMYQTAYIDASSYLDQTVYSMLNQLFYNMGNGTGFAPLTEPNKYTPMLVDNSWGGSYFIGENNHVLTTDMLQIGDLFCGLYKNTDKQDMFWTALYQGNGNFLVQQLNNKTKVKDCFVKTLDQLKAYAWSYSYILRPDNLAS